MTTHGFDGTCEKPVRECRECMRAWLDRKPPPRPPDERSWEEFERAREQDPSGEAGHG